MPHRAPEEIMNPEILETSVLYCRKVFSLIEQQLKLPNGTLTRVETIQHPGATAIVPMIDKSHIILIRQYRYAIRDWIWEIPAGTLSPSENPKDCAHRELTEE